VAYGCSSLQNPVDCCSVLQHATAHVLHQKTGSHERWHRVQVTRNGDGSLKDCVSVALNVDRGIQKPLEQQKHYRDDHHEQDQVTDPP
jgi:hypothetical protein